MLEICLESLVGDDTACGRGIYTSRSWAIAQKYAVPHLLPDSEWFTKTILLLAIPGHAAESGIGYWKHFPGRPRGKKYALVDAAEEEQEHLTVRLDRRVMKSNDQQVTGSFPNPRHGGPIRQTFTEKPWTRDGTKRSFYYRMPFVSLHCLSF